MVRAPADAGGDDPAAAQEKAADFVIMATGNFSSPSIPAHYKVRKSSIQPCESSR